MIGTLGGIIPAISGRKGFYKPCDDKHGSKIERPIYEYSYIKLKKSKHDDMLFEWETDIRIKHEKSLCLNLPNKHQIITYAGIKYVIISCEYKETECFEKENEVLIKIKNIFIRITAKRDEKKEV